MALSFALARAGHSDGQLDTRAEVTLDKDGDGFAVTRSALPLTAQVPGIAAEAFATIAEEAKAGCPISKLLNCELTLQHSLENKAARRSGGSEKAKLAGAGGARDWRTTPPTRRLPTRAL